MDNCYSLKKGDQRQQKLSNDAVRAEWKSHGKSSQRNAYCQEYHSKALPCPSAKAKFTAPGGCFPGFSCIFQKLLTFWVFVLFFFILTKYFYSVSPFPTLFLCWASLLSLDHHILCCYKEASSFLGCLWTVLWCLGFLHCISLCSPVWPGSHYSSTSTSRG